MATNLFYNQGQETNQHSGVSSHQNLPPGTEMAALGTRKLGHAASQNQIAVFNGKAENNGDDGSYNRGKKKKGKKKMG